MGFDASEWIAPNRVGTPDDRLIDDVATYIVPDFDKQALEQLTPEARDKLVVIAERLEFLGHLNWIVASMERRKETRLTTAPMGEGHVRATATYTLIIGNHDFAGFDFDVDAVSLYLLLSCIDTLKGQPDHKSAFSWLSKLNLSCATPPDWKRLENEYTDLYGVTRNFKRAFTDDCSKELQELIATNLAIVQLGVGCFTPGSIDRWEKKTTAAKVKAIADHLYNLRSKFTHKSFRSFTLGIPVDKSLPTDNEVIVQRIGGPGLREIIERVVRHVTVSLLIPKQV